VREGGMAFDNPTSTALSNYAASATATEVMQRFIVEGRDMQTDDFVEHNRHFGSVVSMSKLKRRNEQKKLAEEMGKESALGEGQRLAFCRARDYKTGGFMTVKPIEKMHMHLSGEQCGTTSP
jgi:hypothetical protein